jgi:hypothetical protein
MSLLLSIEYNGIRSLFREVNDLVPIWLCSTRRGGELQSTYKSSIEEKLAIAQFDPEKMGQSLQKKI